MQLYVVEGYNEKENARQIRGVFSEIWKARESRKDGTYNIHEISLDGKLPIYTTRVRGNYYPKTNLESDLIKNNEKIIGHLCVLTAEMVKEFALKAPDVATNELAKQLLYDLIVILKDQDLL